MLSILGIRQSHVTTLIEEFRYPRLGPGQMWETFAKRVAAAGIDIEMQTRSSKIVHDGSRVTSVVVDGPQGPREREVGALLSSIPLSQLVQQLEPAAPPEVLEAAGRLRYRDFVLVALITDEEEPFPDNWIYLHDPETRAGRVQNFGAWSKDMVRPGTTCLGVEYFCFEGDEIWNMSEEDAIDLARAELGKIGLIDPSRVFDGARVHVRKAYPMYDAAYVESVAVLRDYVAGFENLQTFGRNGLHRYNNQDHSMWTAILATLNLLEGASYDLWDVNNEAVYIEEGAAVDEALELGAPSTLIPIPLQQQYEGAA
jgi:protoporphyrinogen oxidase